MSPAFLDTIALAGGAISFAAGTVLAVQGASAKREYRHRIEAWRRHNPDVAPLRHRGRHRRTWHRSLAAWWASTAPINLDAAVRAALSAPLPSPAAPIRIAVMGQPGGQLLTLNTGWRDVAAPVAVRAFDAQPTARPGWRHALPVETPGELVPELVGASRG